VVSGSDAAVLIIAPHAAGCKRLLVGRLEADVKCAA